MARPPAPSDADSHDTLIDFRPEQTLRPGASLPAASETEALPEIEVPPHAARILSDGEDPRAAGPQLGVSLRLGAYALVARFPSSASADVFLGYKTTPFGFLRRAVVKWVDTTRPDQEAARQNLADEARALSGLDHPNVISVFDYVEDEAQGAHLALEYVAGTDLRRCLAAQARQGLTLPWEHACFVITEVLRGLAHIHESKDPWGQGLGIVHRDINPSNVLVGEDGRVKVADFGSVRMKGRLQATTSPGMVKGKVRYLAPEYIAEQACTQLVDVYGAGLILFELLTGHPCFPGTNTVEIMVQIVREGLDYALLDTSAVHPQLASILRRATSLRPEQRFSSAQQMLEAVEAFLSSAGIFTSPSRLAAYMSARDLFS